MSLPSGPHSFEVPSSSVPRVAAPLLLAPLLLAPLLASGCATPPPEEPADLALGRLRASEQWSERRREQLDLLFDRVVETGASTEALSWLRVYVLAQVADRQDRDVRSGELEKFGVALEKVAVQRARDGSTFDAELTRLRAEVQGLRELYGSALTSTSAPVPSGSDAGTSAVADAKRD